MAVARDWLKTLWRSSYKGTPFFVETHEEAGGRRIVKHEAPMRDDPFLEDLGEACREFSLTAYIASDVADTAAAALVAICATRGPGVLVLPTQGPITVRCPEFRRVEEKDKLGYIAFRLNFIREGRSAAMATVSMLANLVFAAADNAAIAIAASFIGNVLVSAQPDFVVSAAVDGVQDAVSTIEAIRTTEPVSPDVSAAQRNEIQSIFDAAPGLIADPVNAATLPARVVAAARAIGYAMPAQSAVAAYEAIVSDPTLVVAVPTVGSATIVNPYPTPFRRAAAQNDAAAKQLLLLSAVTAYCEAIALTSLPDRPSAISLRANLAEYVEAILMIIPAGEIALFHAIAALRDAAVEYLSRAIIDLAPIVTVEANLSMPSLYWAFRLYKDPTRSTELVARNGIAHPSFMPTAFEALAPSK